ncbi:MAG: hypothetical protein H8E72_09880 [Candidatus Marinimicrobia bacterium]|nr:hypothetical protein [Candidatus Neomarinimicrobiota bacterium]
MKKCYLHIVVVVGYFLFVAGSCGNETIAPKQSKGCMDVNACNYDPSVDIQDTSCIYVTDCNGICGGDKVTDNCGVCDGDNSSCVDCSGNINGNAQLDNCGTCDVDTANDCQLDCAGQWGGNSQLDDCGVCGGDSSSCTDCMGMLNGTAIIDECGICSGGTTGIEINSTCDDCHGITNGHAVQDNCGICDNDYTNDCTQDCNGNWGGTAIIDECEVCSGGLTNLVINASCIDCLEIPNGDALEDNCGECDTDSTNDCVQDCHGDWGGSAAFDECGVCGGDNSVCTDCNGVINGLSFVDSCGNCIESIPNSWEIEIIAEVILWNTDSDTLVDGSANYLGADIRYTDGFDGFEVDLFEPVLGMEQSLSFSFYHGDWEDAVLVEDGQHYSYFTSDIRNHNYYEFLNSGKTWVSELRTINYSFPGTAKVTFKFIEGLSNANIVVDVIGSNLSGETYSISDGDSIEGIIMTSDTIVNFDIQISNLCY